MEHKPESDLIQIDVDDQGNPIYGRLTVCDGSSTCPGPHHWHGCYADLDGSACEDPDDHPHVGPGLPITPPEAGRQ